MYELVLTESELEKIQKSRKACYHLIFPVPISRVKSIWFASEEQRANTVFNIESGAAFLPKSLIHTESGSILQATQPVPDIEISKTTSDFENKIDNIIECLGDLL